MQRHLFPLHVYDLMQPLALPSVLPQRYLFALRVCELQEVCSRLGLRKSGRKAELQQRIVSILDGPAR